MAEPVQMVPPGSPLWGQYLRAISHDFYYSEAYHEFMQEEGEGEARLAVAGSREKFLAWPFLLRKLSPADFPAADGLRDVTSVYGYAGPLAYGCSPGDPFLIAAWHALAGLWRSCGVVSVFCRFHPLLNNHLWGESFRGSDGACPTPGLQVACGGRTVSLDLSLNDEQAWAQYRDTHRRHINRARRSGLVCEVDDVFRYLPEFARIYHQTMRRNEASRQYFYSEEFFDRFRRKLDPAIFLHVARAGNQVAAAALVSEYQGVVQYLFGGVDQHFIEISPLKLLIDAVRKWGRSRGDLLLHLGGGRGAREDSLFYFKTGFSPRRHSFFIGRCILDRPVYECLSERRCLEAQRLGKNVDPDFFPAYRAPFNDFSENQTPVLEGKATRPFDVFWEVHNDLSTES